MELGLWSTGNSLECHSRGHGLDLRAPLLNIRASRFQLMIMGISRVLRKQRINISMKIKLKFFSIGLIIPAGLA